MRLINKLKKKKQVLLQMYDVDDAKIKKVKFQDNVGR